tara:strand:- start:125 stop:307 length:183 start_codon:yes stop_codon:yes gene_type:complete
MKVGDLVKACRFQDGRTMLGVIVAQVDEPRATGNDVFRVVWANGDVGEKIWDYDLKKVEA